MSKENKPKFAEGGIVGGDIIADTIIRAEKCEVAIRKIANGFIINVGCKIFVAKEWEEVVDGVGLFFKDPEAAYKKYVKE